DTTSGRVTFRISLQPSRLLKSSNVRSWACNAVPIPPSATSTRSPRAVRNPLGSFCRSAMTVLPPVCQRSFGFTSAAAASPYSSANLVRNDSRSTTYSCGPSVSKETVASVQPSCSDRSSPSSWCKPAKKPARSASPTPVGSPFLFSFGGATCSVGSSLDSTCTPFAPREVTHLPTRSSTSASVQPVLCSSRPCSYSLVNKYSAPSTSLRI